MLFTAKILTGPKKKLEEIVSSHKKIHKSGLNLIYIDADVSDFKDLSDNLKIISMFAEKKLIILKNVFENQKFQEDFLEEMKNMEKSKDIVVIYEDKEADKRTKLFKELGKHALAGQAKCQEFSYLTPALLRKWVAQEFTGKKAKISSGATDLLISFVGHDLWRMANEIDKLSNYKPAIEKEDVLLLVKPDIENDIFRTIDALASKDKKNALSLLHKHLEGGEEPLRLLSMIAYQFRNFLMVKELYESKIPYGSIIKKTGLHPFVVQKSIYMSARFSMPQLKKIYHKIFKADSDIKTGKIDSETALDLLLSEI